MAERINAFEWLMKSSRSDDIQGSNDNNFQIDDHDPETTEFIYEVRSLLAYIFINC